MFVGEFLFDDGSFDLWDEHPGMETNSEFSTLKDHVLEVQVDLLNFLFSLSLQIAKFRVLHDYIINVSIVNTRL